MIAWSLDEAEASLQEDNRSCQVLGITPAQAKRLGFTHQELLKILSESEDTTVFQQALKERGVNSKPLREKLSKLLQR